MRRVRKWLIGLTILGFIAILASGCAKQTLVISDLKAEQEVVPLGHCQIECIASEPDGGELKYEWQASGGSISGKGFTITWVAPAEPGEYTISVIVTDEDGNRDTRSIIITVSELKAEQKVSPSGCCQVEYVAAESDGSELKYEWQASGGSISGKGSTITWVAPAEPGEYTISVIATDKDGNKDTRSIIITVRENHPPEIVELRTSEDRVVPSGSSAIECVASDPDGDSLSYEWSASGGGISGEDNIVTWTAPSEADVYDITVVVKDDMGGESSASLPIKVAVNHPPVIERLIAKSPRLRPASETTIECTAQDPDGDELSCSWSTSGGRIFAKGCVATWVAPNCDGTYDITVVVKDGRGGEATQTVPVEVGCG